jgi:deoxyribonuclease V
MLHRWDISPKEAVAVQRSLIGELEAELSLGKPETVAGVDVSYIRESNESIATVAVLSLHDLQPTEVAAARVPTPFPYVPGLLSFREVPPILEAFGKLSQSPDLIFVDGHGRAHPRRIGIASHLGLWLEKPTIGIGKSRLCGRYKEPGQDRGSVSDLVDRDECIGCVLRTRSGVKPVFVSVGYGLLLEVCVEWTLKVTTRYRLPEPIRTADRIAAQCKKGGTRELGTPSS